MSFLTWIQAACTTIMGIIYIARRKGYIDELIDKEELLKNMKSKYK